MSTSSACLVVVRHGETSANLDGVWHGSTDTPLTERGHAQAARVARFVAETYPDATALYSSDLQRAHHTARPIAEALGLAPRLEPALREYDLGGWEGKTYRELFEVQRLWHHMREDPHFAPHGGESPLAVTLRFTEALERIAASHAEERVVVVAHGGALSMAFAQLLDGDYTQWKRVMDNCAVSELRLHPSPSLLRFNHTDHLAGV
ncbi:MAG: histidine phosphatase family protein [Myxococcota bacterium]